VIAGDVYYACKAQCAGYLQLTLFPRVGDWVESVGKPTLSEIGNFSPESEYEYSRGEDGEPGVSPALPF